MPASPRRPKCTDNLRASSTCRGGFTFVAIDGGAQEDEVGAQHRLHQRQRDRRRLVDDQQLRGAEARVVLRLDVLHRLRSSRHCSAASTVAHCVTMLTDHCCIIMHTLKQGGTPAAGRQAGNWLMASAAPTTTPNAGGQGHEQRWRVADLSVVAEHVDAHNGFGECRVGGLHQVIVQVLLQPCPWELRSQMM